MVAVGTGREHVRPAKSTLKALEKWDTGKLVGSDHGRGHNQTTATGHPFWALDPRPEDIRIEDLARQLSRICRFSGAIGRHVEFYSVAQHCCLVSDHCPPGLRLEGLLHDAHEAYIGDLLKPLKLNLKKLGIDWKLLEHPLEVAVRRRYGLPDAMSPEVKRQDYLAVATEHKALQIVTGEVDWGDLPTDTWPEPIDPWLPSRAYVQFMNRFKLLYKGE